MLVGVILIVLYNSPVIESFRGRHGGHRKRHGGGHGGIGRWWYYPRARYIPPRPLLWYNPWTWFGSGCKNGCTNIGRGKWGCPYPGYGVNDCWFASDCRGCDPYY